MTRIKYFLLVCLVYSVIPVFGQTLIGLSGGINWSTLVDNIPENVSYSGSYKTFPSYSFQLEIKGRKPQVAHLGLSMIYYQSDFNWQYESGGHFPNGQNARFKVNWLRVSVIPEFTFGKKLQFFFNISPYFGFMVTSWKSSSSNSSAKEDFNGFDFGFQESIGFTYYIKSWLGITLQQSGNFSFLNINKTTSVGGNIKNASLHLLAGVYFIIPKKNKIEDIQKK